jgi:hypothetical protein
MNVLFVMDARKEKEREKECSLFDLIFGDCIFNCYWC